MRFLLVFVFSIQVFFTYANGEEAKTDKKFKVGVNFSPDFCYRYTLATNTSLPLVEAKKLLDQSEIPKFGYTFGFNLGYDLKPWVGLEMGVQYSNKGYKTKKSELFFPLPTTGQTFYSQRYDFHYLDFPVKVNFTIGKKSARFFTSIGIVTNVFLQEIVATKIESKDGVSKKSKNSSFDYNKVNLTPMFSVGIDYKINNRMNIRVEPTFRYGVLTIINKPLRGYLYNAGLNISYYFGVK